MVAYTLYIPTAGIGSRLGSLTSSCNKSLMTVGTQPVLWKIIQKAMQTKYPVERVVIALGFNGAQVKELFEHVNLGVDLEFVNVDPFEGEGSGLGETLRQSRKYLQSPFIFWACDALVESEIPLKMTNWVAVSRKSLTDEYRSVTYNNYQVEAINDKGFSFDTESSTQVATYAGICGVVDTDLFWSTFDQAQESTNVGEVAGLRGLVPSLEVIEVEWADIGSEERLREIQQQELRASQEIHVLPKDGEAIWFFGDTVVKFATDQLFISNRTERSKALADYVPKVVQITDHMYSYNKQPGTVLSKCVDLDVFINLMEHSRVFWKRNELTITQLNNFRKTCLNFYRDKTINRLNQFWALTSEVDGGEIINGVEIPSLESMLAQINWENLSSGVPVRFHGDFHFENILYSEDIRNFVFLDWRQDFGGNIEIGDIYYDLAKLLHGLYIPHASVVLEKFSLEKLDDGSRIAWIDRPEDYSHYETYLNLWTNENGLDFRRVQILAALVLLNIAPLHHKGYREFLYVEGKRRLSECV